MTKKRLLRILGVVLLAISTVLVILQGSFDLKGFGPSNPAQTFIFWAVSSLIFVLMVTLGFILFRELVKLYIARQSGQLGSRIRTKLVLGALALSSVPVLCLVLFSYEVLGHSVQRWFAKPVDEQIGRYMDVANLLRGEMRDEVTAQAGLLAAQPETHQALTTGVAIPGFLERFAKSVDAESAALYASGGDHALDSYGKISGADSVRARVPVHDGTAILGYAELAAAIPVNVAEEVAAINMYNSQWMKLRDDLRNAKLFYTMLMILITLFVLFVEVWIAFFLAKQISVPIAALLDAAREVCKGNF